MSNTTYRNASGLPDGGQVTTVRDQAILGIAIYQHFPNYYEFFQTRNYARANLRATAEEARQAGQEMADSLGQLVDEVSDLLIRRLITVSGLVSFKNPSLYKRGKLFLRDVVFKTQLIRHFANAK